MRPEVYVRQVFALLFVCLVGLIAPVSAQSDVQILYSPLVMELAGNRGAAVPFEITIMNQAQFSTAYFRAYTTGLREGHDGVYRTFDDTEWEFGASSWIELEADEFAIPPGQGHVVRGHVHIPRRGPASGYATVVLELVPEPAPGDVAASTAYYQRFTTALEIIVGNQHRRSAYISEMQVVPTNSSPQLAATYGPNLMLFLATLQNDGDVHVKGSGQLIIRDTLGRRLRSVPLGSGRGVVIPEAAVDYGSILRSLGPGTYEVEARINYGGHRPAVARTTFEVSDQLAGISAAVGGRGVRVDATPARIDVNLLRHGYRATTITVTNYDDMDVRFTATAHDLIHDADGVPIQPEEGAHVATSARDWVQIRPEEFVLRPGQRRNVVVGFQVPEGHDGGRYARLRIQAEPVGDSHEPGTIVTDVDVSAYLIIGSDHPVQLELVDVLWQQVSGQPTVAVGAMVSNSGTIHTPVSGRFTLLQLIPASEELFDDVVIQRDERWEAIEQIMAEVSESPVLPGELRFMQGALATELQPSTQYQVVYEVLQPNAQPILHRVDLWTNEAGMIQEGTMPEASTVDGVE